MSIPPTVEGALQEARKLVQGHYVTCFLEHFRVTLDPFRAEKCIEPLQELDPRKGGLVRFQLESDSTNWPDETKEIVRLTAETMGMFKRETPLEGDWDLVIALGGARRANFDRLNYAAEAIAQGRATTQELIIVGSFERLLSEKEREFTASFAPGATTEYALCESAYEEVNQHYQGLVNDCVGVHAENAPGLFQGILEDHVVERMAVVTTQIYRMFTLFDLARVASWNLINEVMVAGNPSDPKIVAARTTATYLSEIIRTIIAAIKLLADLD